MFLADIFTLSLNLAGNCGLSMPCGFDSNGLPIGLQLLGPALGKEKVARAAHAFGAGHRLAFAAPAAVKTTRSQSVL